MNTLVEGNITDCYKDMKKGNLSALEVSDLILERRKEESGPISHLVRYAGLVAANSVVWTIEDNKVIMHITNPRTDPIFNRCEELVHLDDDLLLNEKLTREIKNSYEVLHIPCDALKTVDDAFEFSHYKLNLDKHDGWGDMIIERFLGQAGKYRENREFLGALYTHRLVFGLLKEGYLRKNIPENGGLTRPCIISSYESLETDFTGEYMIYANHRARDKLQLLAEVRPDEKEIYAHMSRKPAIV